MVTAATFFQRPRQGGDADADGYLGPAGQVGLQVERALERAGPAHPQLQLFGGSPRRLRELRAVQVLEFIGTAAARGVLQDLAKGVTEASLTRHAQAALGRLAKRFPTRP